MNNCTKKNWTFGPGDLKLVEPLLQLNNLLIDQNVLAKH